MFIPKRNHNKKISFTRTLSAAALTSFAAGSLALGMGSSTPHAHAWSKGCPVYITRYVVADRFLEYIRTTPGTPGVLPEELELKKEQAEAEKRHMLPFVNSCRAQAIKEGKLPKDTPVPRSTGGGAAAPQPQQKPDFKLPDAKDLPKLPKDIKWPQLPKDAKLPQLPKMPSFPQAPAPAPAPQAPQLPQLPKLPSFPQAPKLPGLPQLPTLPGFPKLPGL